jgi:Tfp pilus assembly protein PilF
MADRHLESILSVLPSLLSDSQKMTPDATAKRESLARRAALYCLHSARRYMKARAWQKAVSSLKEAATIQPEFFEAHCLMGEVYMELDLLEQAVEAFERAIRLRPDDTATHLKLGLAYVAQHDWNAALGQFQILRTLNEVVANELFDKIIYSFNYEMYESLFNQIQ